MSAPHVVDTASWESWQRDYRFGMILVIPPPDVASSIDALRQAGFRKQSIRWHGRESSKAGSTMTSTRRIRQFIVALALSGASRLRRFLKRLMAPGSGPFLAGC